ncbi:MAG: helix-turn-helix domain-containing protein [Myxococcales bacterium]
MKSVIIEPVVDEKSHRKALRQIEQLWDAAPGSAQERHLDALATLVDAYERRTTPIPPPDPVDAIAFRMEALGLTRHDLEPYIGSRARVSEVLTRKRALTLAMIRKLHQNLGIPAEILIGEPRPLRKVASVPLRSTKSRRAAQRSSVFTVTRRKSRPA